MKGSISIDAAPEEHKIHGCGKTNIRLMELTSRSLLLVLRKRKQLLGNLNKALR
jgi:hypothetical protein